MEKKGVRVFWYGIAAAFSLTGIFADKGNIFIPLGGFFLVIGNIRSRKQ